MTLLQPSYLWGLLALAIPIAIHFWSRKKVQIIQVGSTQFIAETKSKQTNSLQINEWWLLFLRCLIMSTLVFILTEPQHTKTSNSQDIAYVFEPSLLATEEGRSRFKEIPIENRLLLSKGFPEWEEGRTLPIETPDYWQLARQMEAISADSIVVFTRALAKGFKGKRPKLKKNITWIPIDLDKPLTEPVFAKSESDSIQITSVQSDENIFAFAKARYPKSAFNTNGTNDSLELKNNDYSSQIPLRVEEPIKITLVYDLELESQLKFFEVGLHAIARYTNRRIEVVQKQLSDTLTIGKEPYVVWLSTKEMPEYGDRTLQYQPDNFAQKLIVPGTSQTHFFLTDTLTTERVLKEQWLDLLVHWLALDQDLKVAFDRLDMRTLAINEVDNTLSSDVPVSQIVVSVPISKWLWIVLIILIIGERWIAKLRKQ